MSIHESRRAAPFEGLPGELTKTCKRCGEVLPASADFFHRHPVGKLGFHSKCRPCRNEEKRDLHRTPKYQATVKAYYSRHRDKIAAYNKSRPPLSAEKLAEAVCRARRSYEANKDRARAWAKAWRNTPEGKAKSRIYRARSQARRLQRNSEYALRNRTMSAIATALSQGRKTARGRWWEAACGYSLEQLREHLERQFAPGMTWENRGKVWEIDHIRPISGFVVPDAQCEAFREAWGLANLQPLFKADNKVKGARNGA